MSPSPWRPTFQRPDIKKRLNACADSSVTMPPYAAPMSARADGQQQAFASVHVSWAAHARSRPLPLPESGGSCGRARLYISRRRQVGSVAACASAVCSKDLSLLQVAVRAARRDKAPCCQSRSQSRRRGLSDNAIGRALGVARGAVTGQHPSKTLAEGRGHEAGNGGSHALSRGSGGGYNGRRKRKNSLCSL